MLWIDICSEIRLRRKFVVQRHWRTCLWKLSNTSLCVSLVMAANTHVPKRYLSSRGAKKKHQFWRTIPWSDFLAMPNNIRTPKRYFSSRDVKMKHWFWTIRLWFSLSLQFLCRLCSYPWKAKSVVILIYTPYIYAYNDRYIRITILEYYYLL